MSVKMSCFRIGWHRPGSFLLQDLRPITLRNSIGRKIHMQLQAGGIQPAKIQAVQAP